MRRRFVIPAKAGIPQGSKISYFFILTYIEEIKATQKISSADCFGAALAKQRSGAICLGHPEFRALQPEWKIV
jgi:hypothetical protein